MSPKLQKKSRKLKKKSKKIDTEIDDYVCIITVVLRAMNLREDCRDLNLLIMRNWGFKGFRVLEIKSIVGMFTEHEEPLLW